jgi:hypothetical protein
MGWIIVFVYFLPTIIALFKEPREGFHNNPGQLFLLNLLLGWTIIGWAYVFARAIKGWKKE